ncbi:MAG: YncE family protein, partial [Proteobacteria bacterium]|nr:YncE family protein [Pseudomonadota bacterium]
IRKNPIRNIVYKIILNQQLVPHFEPSAGQRFLDDLFLSPDGNTIYVSRSNLGDVAAFDLSKPEHSMLWRTVVPFYKADHATLSPDGKQLVVSASGADKVLILDTANGKKIGSFKTGHLPHQNDYSPDGAYIYNGSLGRLGLPYALNSQKGARQLTVADARTFKVIRTYSLPAGVRPSVFSKDGKTLYAQLSYLNGLIKYDLQKGEIIGKSEQALSDFAQATYPGFDDYPHNSAHHGLAISGDESKLCDAGTVDNTVSIVSSADLSVSAVVDVGMIPYWATTSVDGKRCFVSLSGDDAIAVIDFETGKLLTQVPVGKFPQRSRLGVLPEKNLEFLDNSSADSP